VGGPALAGSSGYGPPAGLFTVTGAGNDVWGDADQFQFAHRTLTGDGTIIARLLSQSPSDPWAKAGVMMKEAATAGSPYAFLAVTPGHGVHLQSAFSVDQAGDPAPPAPLWLRLTRQGTTVTAETSSDGTTWTTVGTTQLAWGSSVQVGLAVTSHNGAALSTAMFDNVSV
jgi:regulation of enolase protein 1 (concanavalin A-like superfamily)